MELYILQNYNNYYNRIVKRENSLDDYLEYGHYPIYDANFHSGDGVNTTHIAGGPISAYTGFGDYLIAAAGTQIISRWFIIENKKMRAGQFELTLRRDLIVDFYDDIVKAPMFIEKASVRDYFDSAVFNKETMTFNQIKQNEVLLKDATQAPWIVGYYLPTNAAEGVTEMSVTVDSNAPQKYEEISNINEWEFREYLYTPAVFANRKSLSYWSTNEYQIGGSDLPENNILMTFTFEGDKAVAASYQNGQDGAAPFSDYIAKGLVTNLSYNPTDYKANLRNVDSILANVIQQREGVLDGALNAVLGSKSYDYANNLYDRLLAQNGKIIRDAQSGNYFKIKIKVNSKTYPNPEIKQPEIGSNQYSLFDSTWVQMGEWIDMTFYAYSQVPNGNGFICQLLDETSVKVELEKLPVERLSLSIPLTGATKATCKDAPYNIFCLPYLDNFYTVREDGAITSISSIDVNMRLVNALIEKYSGNNGILLDVQLLPFCPCQEVVQNIRADGRLELFNVPEENYSYWTTGENVVAGYIYHCGTSRLETIINKTIYVPNTPLELKIENECDMYRLVSPNWNGQFEFSVAKNYGVRYFEVDMELKPYNPYIHVAPNFQGLYGNRENDPTGLICGGDFGLTMISDAWANYERQNKNYQVIFNRQILNLETTQDVQRKQELANIIIGSVSGGNTGAAAGYAITGGPVGAGIGGAIGAGASLAGGLQDRYYNDLLRNEALDFTNDQFTAQLGNIKALPDSLTRVSSFNANNRLFVVLEYYSCTDIEKEALKNKLKYNGMTINRIGTINDFIQSEPQYIKGKLIRLENIAEDTHTVNCIAEELNKGVYI